MHASAHTHHCYAQVGAIEFSGSIQYNSFDEWAADTDKHLVPPDTAMFGWSDAEEKHGWTVSNFLRFVEPCPPPALARQFRSFFELIWALPTPESLSCYIKQLPQPFEPNHPELCVLHNDVPFPCAVTVEGVEYASAEHYYQAIRTHCNRQRSRIVAATTTSAHALLLLPRLHAFPLLLPHHHLLRSLV